MNDKVNPIQIQKFLSGVDYPADKADLLQAAEENGADDAVLSMLQCLPEQSYDGPTAVSEEISNE